MLIYIKRRARGQGPGPVFRRAALGSVRRVVLIGVLAVAGPPGALRIVRALRRGIARVRVGARLGVRRAAAAGAALDVAPFAAFDGLALLAVRPARVLGHAASFAGDVAELEPVALRDL